MGIPEIQAGRLKVLEDSCSHNVSKLKTKRSCNHQIFGPRHRLESENKFFFINSGRNVSNYLLTHFICYS